MTDHTKQVVRNDDKNRYEVLLDGELAGFAAYTPRGDQVVFTHTEIDGAFAGKGLGKVLAAGALDDVVARELVIVPVCPFIAGFVRKNEQYDGHVKWPE
ncbi:GNAT family N-acetyltransferase [Kibdelosporangium persicum]|uniref:Acetyltransferase n=1 Tax=Kibdelosporangium persicum TaxID=2698649 RepID=A0ABX2EUX2_9PSEU|nr:GNAT family N-acetyltransferase [Kibdelosporangium persicum]NRN62831.1 putative acetyltransferase [Kibdelosporangium persicum]